MPALFQTLTVAALTLTATAGARAAADTRQWFQATEQALMDAVAIGDVKVWDRILDESCVLTSEEGEVTTKQELLKQLRPLPPGLKGAITVRDLTVQEFPTFAVVRFLADESETVFSQQLATKYRVTNTYLKADAGWKMIASHTAVVTQDPPPQKVATDGWPGLAGRYQIAPDGWTFHVVLRDGTLYGGRDPQKLKPFIPLTPTAFVLQGSLGDWLFVVGPNGKATAIVDFRKFEPLVWTRVGDTP
jgi:hypothetical protein